MRLGADATIRPSDKIFLRNDLVWKQGKLAALASNDAPVDTEYTNQTHKTAPDVNLPVLDNQQGMTAVLKSPTKKVKTAFLSLFAFFLFFDEIFTD